MKTGIPIYKAKEESSDNNVEGYYFVEVEDDEESLGFNHISFIKTPYGDHYTDVEIDTSTLEISFDNGKNWRSIAQVAEKWL